MLTLVSTSALPAQEASSGCLHFAPGQTVVEVTSGSGLWAVIGPCPSETILVCGTYGNGQLLSFHVPDDEGLIGMSFKIVFVPLDGPVSQHCLLITPPLPPPDPYV